MTSNPLVIANWEDGFEIAQSRRRAGRLSWVAMPTRHDSRGYRKLMRQDGGVEAFACWCVMVQLAARMSIRGILADDRGNPLDVFDFEAMTDIPATTFERSIPLLCKVGWLECPVSYTTQSVVRQDSEQDTTTVHTEQDKTEQKQNRTADSSLVYRSKHDAETAWQLLPKGRKIGKHKWLRAYAQTIVLEDLDSKMVMESICEYYKSGEGQSDYFRNPATLLKDRIWEEEPESWNAKHKKPIDASDEEAAFAKVYGDE